MDFWTWIEVLTWWLIALDSFIYNLIAWGGNGWYKSKFPNLAQAFPSTKAFGLLYGGLVIWVGSDLSRAEVPLFGH